MANPVQPGVAKLLEFHAQRKKERELQPMPVGPIDAPAGDATKWSPQESAGKWSGAGWSEGGGWANKSNDWSDSSWPKASGWPPDSGWQDYAQHGKGQDSQQAGAAGRKEGASGSTSASQAPVDPAAAVLALATAPDMAQAQETILAALQAAGGGANLQGIDLQALESKAGEPGSALALPKEMQEMLKMQEMQVLQQVQVMQQQQQLLATQHNLAAHLLEQQGDKKTSMEIVELQAQHMTIGTFGFGCGPLGDIDMSPASGGWRAFTKGVAKGEMKQPLIARDRVYTGIITSYDAVKKSGRIECEEIRQQTGGRSDVYVYQDVLSRAHAGVGDVVCFITFQSKRGQLQASSPMVRTATHNGFAQTGIFRTGGPCDHKTEGGTIDCYETKRVFGREARVPKELVKDLMYGRRVAFNAYMNPEGAMIVVSCKEVDEGYAPRPGDLTFSHSMQGYAGPPPARFRDSQEGDPAILDAGTEYRPTKASTRAEIEEKRRRLMEKKANNPRPVEEPRPGDWKCPGCGDLQFARNSHCRRCSTPKGRGTQLFGRHTQKEDFLNSEAINPQPVEIPEFPVMPMELPTPPPAIMPAALHQVMQLHELQEQLQAAVAADAAARQALEDAAQLAAGVSAEEAAAAAMQAAAAAVPGDLAAAALAYAAEQEMLQKEQQSQQKQQQAQAGSRILEAANALAAQLPRAADFAKDGGKGSAAMGKWAEEHGQAWEKGSWKGKAEEPASDKGQWKGGWKGKEEDYQAWAAGKGADKGGWKGKFEAFAAEKGFWNLGRAEEASTEKGFWKGKGDASTFDKGFWKGKGEEPATFDKGSWKGKGEEPALDKGCWKGKGEEPSVDKGYWKGKGDDFSFDKGLWKGKGEEPSFDKGFWKGKGGEPAFDKGYWKGKSDESSFEKGHSKGLGPPMKGPAQLKQLQEARQNQELEKAGHAPWKEVGVQRKKEPAAGAAAEEPPRKRKRSFLDQPRHSGTVKSVTARPQGGRQGKIMSEELFLKYGSTILIEEEDMLEGTLTFGAKVTFAIQQVDGQPRARDCEAPSAAEGQEASMC